MAVDIGIVVGNSGAPTAADFEVNNRIEDLGYVTTFVDDASAVPSGREGFVICDSVTAATVGTKYRDLTVPVVTLEFDLWDDNLLAVNTGAVTGASAAFDLVAHTLTTGFADPLTVLTSAQAQRGVLDADLPAGKAIFARPGADATRAMGWTFETGATLTSGTAPARRAALHLPEAWTTILTVAGVDLLERLLEWAFRPFTLTFDPVLSRVRLTTDGLGNAATAFVERSTNQVSWDRVRGGSPAVVTGGALAIDDYEFTPNVPNYYRVIADRDVRDPGIGFAGVAAHGDNASLNPAVPTAARAKHLLVAYATIRSLSATVGAAPAGYVASFVAGDIAFLAKTHSGSESAPTVTFTGGAAGDSTSAQLVALRNLTAVASSFAQQFNAVAAQDIAYPAFTPDLPRQLVLGFGHKFDDWASVNGRAGYVEIGDSFTTLGNDQGLVWDYAQQAGASPTTVPAGSFTVVGGVSAVSRGGMVTLVPMTVSPSGSITPAQDGVWVKDLVRPFLNRQVTVIEFSEETTPARAGLFEVVGRSREVAVTDVRTGRRQTLTLMFSDRAGAEDFRLALGPGGPVFLQVPATCPFPGMYAVAGDLRVSRTSHRGVRRYVTLPLTEVATPSVDLVGATLTWQTVISSYATWADVIAAEATWADLLEGIGTPADVIVP